MSKIVAVVASIRVVSEFVRGVAAVIVFIRKAFLVVRSVSGAELMVFGVTPIDSQVGSI